MILPKQRDDYLAKGLYVKNVKKNTDYEKGKKTDLKAFYDKMRDKAETRTSLASPDVFYNAFEKLAVPNSHVVYF